MIRHGLNPFRYGAPVPPESFIGRDEVIHTIFSRIRNGESTAVVGEPHIGKSSVLLYVGCDEVKGEWLGEDADRHAFVYVDCQLLPSHYRPGDFWEPVLARVEEVAPGDETKSQLAVVRECELDGFALKGVFDLLARHGGQIVLLMDEFDTLLHHSTLGTHEFFGTLRSMSTVTRSLVLVVASRLSLAEMNRCTRSLNPVGSPYFNQFREVRLPLLRPPEVDELLDRALGGSGVRFCAEDRAYIRSKAGRHPYLVQAAAAALFDAVQQGASGGRQYAVASRRLRDQTAVHFDDLWGHLSAEAQTAMVALALAEMNRQVGQRPAEINGLGQVAWYQAELRRLAELGLVEMEEDETPGGDWRDPAPDFRHPWRVSAGSFLWWLADNVVDHPRRTLDFEQWLLDREGDRLLTRAGSEKFLALARAIPGQSASVDGVRQATVEPETTHVPRGECATPLTGQRCEQLTRALLDAFPTRARLAEMVRFRLGRNLEAIALGGDLTEVVFRLVVAAEAEGWIARLIVAARESNPGNALLLAFAQQLGLAPAAPPRAELERIIRATNSFLDVEQWRARLGEIEAQVCRIEIRSNMGMIYGTGFLLGPELVMTNHHVMECVIEGERATASDVVLRFDYKRLGDGTTINPGSVFRLHPTDWLVDHSPDCGAGRLPQLDELDYALLRVEGAPGDLPVGSDRAEPGAARRGWIELPAQAYDFQASTALFIVQHPQGEPLKLALDTDAVIELNANGTRITYRTNTEPGSSGSPCFNSSWELVALHHGGADFDRSGKASSNEGIPFSAIGQRLARRSLLGVFPSAQAG